METIKSLFSFKGEISRGEFWLIYLLLGLLSIVFEAVSLGVASFGDAGVVFAGNFGGWPKSIAGWSVLLANWLLNAVTAWILAAAAVKRLRECGIAPKWLVLTIGLMAAVGFAMSHLVHAGDVHLSPLAWVVFVMGGIPTVALCFWVFGSVFFAPSHKPHQFDPSKLPEGWRN